MNANSSTAMAPLGAISGPVTHDTYSFEDFVLRFRFVAGMSERGGNYPISRQCKFSAMVKRERVFDALALLHTWRVYRPDPEHLILDSVDSFIRIKASDGPHACSCICDIWTGTAEEAERLLTMMKAHFHNSLYTKSTFSIEWLYVAEHDHLTSQAMEEAFDDVLHDSAYPSIIGGVDAFIEDYLTSTESVDSSGAARNRQDPAHPRYFGCNEYQKG